MGFITKEVLAGCSIMLLCSLKGSAQLCGVPPGPFQYSANFLRAEAKFLQASSSNSSEFGVAIPEGDLPLHSSNSSNSSVTNWQTLTVQEATQFIQQEHASKKAQIVAECGYRLCTFLSSHNQHTDAAISALSEVCNQASLPDVAGDVLSTSPRNQAVVFNTSAPQSRTISLSNNSAGAVTVRWSIDPGTISNGQGSLQIAALPREFVIAPKRSRAVTVTIRKPQSGQTESPRLVFEAVSDKNVMARTDFAIYPNPALLLPHASVTPGQLYPNAKEQNDQQNANPINQEQQAGPFDFPVEFDHPAWPTSII